MIPIYSTSYQGPGAFMFMNQSINLAHYTRIE